MSKKIYQYVSFLNVWQVYAVNSEITSKLIPILLEYDVLRDGEDSSFHTYVQVYLKSKMILNFWEWYISL